MKNFISIIDPQEIFSYLGNLWRSEIFKQSHNDPNGYIHYISKEFSKTPRIFFDMHQEEMEMVHFSSWFHAIQHRYHYTNDVIHDLYYHHEFFHIITMTHKDNLNFEEWSMKMSSNEFWASLESEVLIYFYMPELRKQSFNKKLWVDKFLTDSYYKGLFNKYFHLEDDLARKLKSRIAYFRDNCQFNPLNEIENEIAEYTTSSNEFAKVWKEEDAWLNVETEMVKYLKNLKNDPQEAINSHIDWIKDLQAKDEYEVAFGKQARSYSAVHKRLFQSAYNPRS
jgi:hypothetical protein